MNIPISFALAKILMEIGFEKYTSSGYTEKGEVYLHQGGQEPVKNGEGYYEGKNYNGNKFYCSRPTIDDVVTWFYEKYGLWISCEKIDSYQELFYYNITDSKGHKITAIEWDDEKCDEMGYNNKYHKLPNEAYEAAFKHVLNNLI